MLLPSSPALRSQLFQLVICLAMGAILSVLAGQDANWDLRNYHLYTASSLLSGRFDQDFFAADLQSGYNPVLDFPYVVLALGPLAAFPRILAAVMGLWFGLLAFLTLRIARRLFSNIPDPDRWFLIVLGTLVALTSVGVFAQIGSTTNDIQSSVPLLAGILCVFRAIDEEKSSLSHPSLKLILGGGFLVGLSTGAKLTGATYGPALCLALLSIMTPRQWLRICIIFCLSWLCGFLLTSGWWGWMLWERFQNPTFPLFNNIFRSPWMPPISTMDRHFVAETALQWIFYPFYWAWHPKLVYEETLRDPRIAIAYSSMVLLGIVWIIRRLRRVRPNFAGASELTNVQKLAFTFLVTSYIGWLISSSFLRYAIPLDVLCVLGTFIVIQYLTHQFFGHRARSIAIIVTLILSGLSLFGTKDMDWPRVAYGDKVFDVDMSWTPPDTLFVAVVGPVAYLAVFVPPEAHAQFVGLGFITTGGEGWPLGDFSKKLVANHRGPIKVLYNVQGVGLLPLLSRLGLSPQLDKCRIVHSNLDVPLNMPVTACDTFRSPKPE